MDARSMVKFSTDEAFIYISVILVPTVSSTDTVYVINYCLF
jgi:hypothetical protein